MSKFFRIPPDILCSLKREFPEVKNLEMIIDKLFDHIFKKTITDGACSITKFGHFFAFKAFSRRIGKIVPRFKFSMSRPLYKMLCDDQYLLDRIPETRDLSPRVSMVSETGDKSGGEARRRAESNRTAAKEKMLERMAQDEISAILEESFDV